MSVFLGNQHTLAGQRLSNPNKIRSFHPWTPWTDAHLHKDKNYNPDKANITACVMVQIYKQAQIHGTEFVQQHLEEYKEIGQQ